MRQEGKIHLNLSLAVMLTAALAFALMQFAVKGVPAHPKGLPAAQAKVARGISDAAFGTAAETVQLCDMYSWGSAARDRPVRVLGRLHICNGEEQWLPGQVTPAAGQAVLYRYINSCCTGHAVPGVLELHGAVLADSREIPEDAWVELRGFFQPALEPGAMPGLRVESLSLAAEAPLQPMEQMFPPSKMAGRCQGSRPQITYPPR